MEQKQKLVINLVTEKETVRTVRFEELVPPDSEPVTNYIYVQKKALAKLGNPGVITITIEAGESYD